MNFKKGDIVYHKLSRVKGIVIGISSFWGGNRVAVRVVVKENGTVLGYETFYHYPEELELSKG